MLGLPSTTEVAKGGRIPKEAFYRNLALPAKVKESFVADVEGFRVANTVKASTANLAEGPNVKEIAVLRVGLKGDGVDPAVLDEIAKANPRKILFACLRPDGTARLSARIGGKIVSTPDWKPESEWRLRLEGANLDEAWEAIQSQIAFGDTGSASTSVTERLARQAKVESLCAKIEATDRKCRKEKQLAKKNRLFAELKGLEEELRALEQEE